MKCRHLSKVLTALLVASLGCMATAQAEALRAPAHRARHASMDDGMPSRGMSMAQVRHRYGAPKAVLAKAGGDTHRHPTINRWRYAGYTVYFERSRVIHSVRDNDAAPPRA